MLVLDFELGLAKEDRLQLTSTLGKAKAIASALDLECTLELGYKLD